MKATGKRNAMLVVLALMAVGVAAFMLATSSSPQISPVSAPTRVSMPAAEKPASRWDGPAKEFVLIQGLAASPERPGNIYVATFTGLVVGVNSSDTEYEWLYVSGERLDVSGFLVHPEKPNVFYSFGHPSPGEDTGIRRSEDWGQTWRVLTNQIDPHGWAISRSDPDVMYALDFRTSNLFKSANGGMDWTSLEAPARVLSITVHPKNENVVLVGTEAGLYRSRDGGLNWESLSAEMAGAMVSAVAYSPHDPQTIYARSFFGLFKSADGGETWRLMVDEKKDMPHFLLEVVRFMDVDNFNPNVVYAAGGSGESYAHNISAVSHGAGPVIYKSLDGGETWFVIRGPDAEHSSKASLLNS